ncbi:alpha/beta hydrolase [Pedobacter psychrodurus]|uniref:Alpha/beta hydrolase n=1 Tax=Pedobacter psychrodurus TaxID=2530456 RepID=A0A4R0PV83_9SPHI|nr:alpha/beta hydrolase [Pedobacter psychrodurus]TCD26498.1 alpha/beta hydrolase [Pedobacter psychrodurus]
MKSIKSKTVVFVTGAFVSHIGWDKWVTYFESKGYKAIAPSWPFKEDPPAEIRKRQPDARIASLNLTQVVDNYANIINALPEKPIIIGHSLGGLITQLLVQRGLADAAVIYHSVPPQGVLSFKWSFLKGVTPSLGLFTSADKTYLMSFKHWQYTFTNGMPLAYQQEMYNKLVIPESKRAARGALSSQGKVDFKRPHVPLLFLSGTKDNIIPPSLNYTNFKKYSHTGSIREYKEYPDKNHLAMDHANWREETDFIIDWLNNH